MTPVNHHLRWDDVAALAETLADSIQTATGVRSFDRVIGVARGGLVPAVLVAARLEVKRVETVQVQLYEGATKLSEPRFLGRAPEPSGPSGDPARSLVIDEILDSGTTMAYLQAVLPSAHFGALVVRSSEQCTPSEGGLLRCVPAVGGAVQPRPVWVSTSVCTKQWILFPWSPPEDEAAAAEAGAS